MHSQTTSHEQETEEKLRWVPALNMWVTEDKLKVSGCMWVTEDKLKVSGYMWVVRYKLQSDFNAHSLLRSAAGMTHVLR